MMNKRENIKTLGTSAGSHLPFFAVDFTFLCLLVVRAISARTSVIRSFSYSRASIIPSFEASMALRADSKRAFASGFAGFKTFVTFFNRDIL